MRTFSAVTVAVLSFAALRPANTLQNRRTMVRSGEDNTAILYVLQRSQMLAAGRIQQLDAERSMLDLPNEVEESSR